MALMDVGNQMVWQALKLYLPVGTRLTSVYRPPQSQLDFIVATARKEGYRFARPASLADPSTWRDALESIRKRGYKVAAPGTSAHQRGVAYDLTSPNLEKIEAAVRAAVAHKRITLATATRSPLLIETQNHCVHVEIQAAILDFEPFEWA